MSVPYQGTELFMNVQIQEIREDQRKLQRVVTQVRGGQWVLAALFVVLACCLFYCTVHIKTVSETLTATHKSVGELSESFRESSESFTKEMKEINSSLITSLRNLTETMVELTKELQEMKASPYKLQNQTKNFSVADVKDSRAFSDSLSAEFADESVFARLMEGLVTNIQHVFEWMYHEKNKLVVDAAEYISKIEKTKLFDAAQYIFATIMVVFAYKEICRRVQNSNAHDQAGNAGGHAVNAGGHAVNAGGRGRGCRGGNAGGRGRGRGRNAGDQPRNARGRFQKVNLVIGSSVCFPFL